MMLEEPYQIASRYLIEVCPVRGRPQHCDYVFGRLCLRTEKRVFAKYLRSCQYLQLAVAIYLRVSLLRSAGDLSIRGWIGSLKQTQPLLTLTVQLRESVQQISIVAYRLRGKSRADVCLLRLEHGLKLTVVCAKDGNAVQQV